MTGQRVSFIACVIALPVLLTGCIAVGGSDRVYAPTKGKQLMDLKAALDSGALTQAEYDETKHRILHGG